MKIILLGFMGSGKSTVASEISRLSSLELVELDERVVSSSARESIPEIFKLDGEEHFRKLETAALKSILSEEGFVLSPGGGIVEKEENREILRGFNDKSDPATLVFLDTQFETIVERIGSSADRPLFQDLDNARERFELRAPLYRKLADIIIPTESYSPCDLAEIILASVGQGLYSRLLWSVIGNPVGHSRSPRLHNALLRTHHVQKGFFSATKVKNLQKYILTFRANPALRGLAVTIPHKEEILPYVDELSDDAREIGAVNTIVKKGSALCGFNTDWIGIRDPLEKRASIEGKSMVVLGAGGTARAAIFAGKSSGGTVTVVNRSEEKGRTLAEECGVSFLPLNQVADLKEFDFVVHTTSVGLDDPDSSLFEKDAFREGMVVLDAVYSPEMTKLLKEAESVGAEIVSGVEMFCAQARAQYELHHESEVSPGEVTLGEVTRALRGKER